MCVTQRRTLQVAIKRQLFTCIDRYIGTELQRIKLLASAAKAIQRKRIVPKHVAVWALNRARARNSVDADHWPGLHQTDRKISQYMYYS